MSQERDAIQARTVASDVPENGSQGVTQSHSPAAASDADECAAAFGNAVIDALGEALLQTMPQDASDYIRPVRLGLHGQDPMKLSTEIYPSGRDCGAFLVSHFQMARHSVLRRPGQQIDIRWMGPRTWVEA